LSHIKMLYSSLKSIELLIEATEDLNLIEINKLIINFNRVTSIIVHNAIEDKIVDLDYLVNLGLFY
jgi:hypothetical protein